MREPSSSAAWRLAVARALAWGLWLAAWLALGALGRRVAPLWAGGTWALALCLLGVGAGMALLSLRPWSVHHLRWAVPLLGALAGGGLVAGAGWLALAGAAVAWGGLLVAASQAVRVLRQGQSRAPAPVLPAAVGALLAWGVAGNGEALRPSAWPLGLALAAAALALSALLPARALALRSCRAGLFDCAWPVPAAGAWREPGQWPMVAARLSMLPMMAALPLMGEWCAAEFRWAPGLDAAAHLAAMMGPAVLLRAWQPAGLLRRPELAVLALQLLGAVLLAWRPGLGTLTLAALCQALAWSLAWAVPLWRRVGDGPVHGGALGLGRAAVAAVAVLALGAWLADTGPQAWLTIQLAWALLALAGAAMAWATRRRAPLEELP